MKQPQTVPKELIHDIRTRLVTKIAVLEAIRNADLKSAKAQESIKGDRK